MRPPGSLILKLIVYRGMRMYSQMYRIKSVTVSISSPRCQGFLGNKVFTLNAPASNKLVQQHVDAFQRRSIVECILYVNSSPRSRPKTAVSHRQLGRGFLANRCQKSNKYGSYKQYLRTDYRISKHGVVFLPLGPAPGWYPCPHEGLQELRSPS